MRGLLWSMAMVVSLAIAQRADALPADLTTFLAEMDAAQLELQNGRPDAYKALWSRADDVTLAGGLGGVIEKGWPAVARRLDWVGTQFSGGTNRIARVAASASGSLAYVVQTEHLRYTAPGAATATVRDYRVTMVFRRESNQWRIVHRHADTQTAKPVP